MIYDDFDPYYSPKWRYLTSFQSRPEVQPEVKYQI